MADPRPRILLADDDPDIRAILRALLTERDVELFEADNGEAALETLLVEQPDLVVLDVMMPGLSGWEICRYVKQKDALRDTRVLMLTAVGKTVNELTSPLYGADAYLDKPFELDRIDTTIRDLLADVGRTLEPASD
jgi:DNA-binding response OmpR family regulator